MKYVFIEKHQAEFSIKAMCRVLRVARSGWYTWCQRRTRISTRQQFRQHCDSVVLAAFTRSKQRYGAPRLTDELRAQGYPFNVKTVAASLRRQGLTGGTVTLKLKYSYGSGRTAQRRLPHPTDDENIFVAVALELLDNIWQEGMHVRLAGIGMSDFDHQGGIQTDLFCEVDDRGAQSSDRRDLSVAIDAVRDKFGDTALSFGRQSRFND